ncbi:acyltransferase [Methylibium sp.]|uniref:acyltransferase n=1 Tax=Methylibium sp. TaxID=2067992 RepID=UPI00286B4F4D|nr:acyltransferase [Methylibium sp.]
MTKPTVRRPLRPLLQALARAWQRLAAPRMVYGPRGADGVRRAHSRISTHARIESPERLQLGDHVFIGHFNYIDASGGLTIDDGVQITNHVSVLTHSTHLALRLERERYWDKADADTAPDGLQREATHLGAWSFIGPHCVLAPGTRLGRGALVKAYSLVAGAVPDFAIVQGQPARVVGDTRELDRAWIERNADVFDEAARAAYEAWARETPA